MTLSKALRAVPEQLAVHPLSLSIDDTMLEKEGKKFEFCSRLFDHAAHSGSHYLNGHCMVSILLSFPVLADGSIRYLSVPLGYWLWDKKQTKLEIVSGMIRHAMDNIGPDRQILLLCDNWYPKGCVASLVDEYQNLAIICNTRIDTVMYDLPPACYSPRWKIEISYYESNTFWSLEEYRVRSREGIERLVNLECMAYSAMTLLPYSDGFFSCY